MPDNIYMQPGFLSPAECQNLIDYLHEAENWPKASRDVDCRVNISLVGSTLGDLEVQIRGTLQKHFGRLLKLSYWGLTLWQAPHHGQGYHRDDGAYAEGVEEFYDATYHGRIGGCTLYLNQGYEHGQMQPGGFEGGKIQYHDRPPITPEPGLLVGHTYHVHRVTAITKGNRYTVSAFYDRV